MAIITFMSDFGHRDPYVAVVKAKISALNHNATIFDVSHDIEHYNVAHAAFVISSVYKDFPKGTVHILGVNSLNKKRDKFIAAKIDDHYFVGGDNGLFSLLSDKPVTAIVDINHQKVKTTFPELDIFAKAAVYLANEKNIYDLGPQLDGVNRLINRESSVADNRLLGNVVHVDSYGNLITNIDKATFDRVADGRNFEVNIGREHVNKIANSYAEVDEGDCAVVFNSLGLLEVAINKGNASQLLGVRYDGVISIEFKYGLL